jgi:uncharacterized membrane protein YhaH (DUF805 family)
LDNQKREITMFKAPFDFEGRIRRTEYGVSFIAFIIAELIVQSMSAKESLAILDLLHIPLAWFIVAQGVKRCHDINRQGWYQVIPFYVFVLIFNGGDASVNAYGLDPKQKPTVQNL